MWFILQYSYFIVSTIICLTCLLHNRTVYMENVRDGHDLNRIEQDMFLYNQLQGTCHNALYEHSGANGTYNCLKCLANI